MAIKQEAASPPPPLPPPQSTGHSPHDAGDPLGLEERILTLCTLNSKGITDDIIVQDQPTIDAEKRMRALQRLLSQVGVASGYQYWLLTLARTYCQIAFLHTLATVPYIVMATFPPIGIPYIIIQATVYVSERLCPLQGKIELLKQGHTLLYKLKATSSTPRYRRMGE